MTIETILRQETIKQDSGQSLTDSQIQQLSIELFGWEVDVMDDMPHLWRVFKFEDFADALRFTNEVGTIAEAQGHHPKLTTEWGSVTVEWWSHMLGGLHRNDFIMASKTNDIYTHWRDITGDKDAIEEALEETFPASDPRGVSRIE